jgi:hypothetical protein
MIRLWKKLGSVNADRYLTDENIHPIEVATPLKVLCVGLWRSNSEKRDQSYITA